MSDDTSFFDDLIHGEFSAAWAHVETWFQSLPPSVQKFVKFILSAEGKILSGLAVDGAQQVIAGGLKTEVFVSTAKDIEAKLIEQNITMARTQIFTALNAAVTDLNTAAQ